MSDTRERFSGLVNAALRPLVDDARSLLPFGDIGWGRYRERADAFANDLVNAIEGAGYMLLPKREAGADLEVQATSPTPYTTAYRVEVKLEPLHTYAEVNLDERWLSIAQGNEFEGMARSLARVAVGPMVDALENDIAEKVLRAVRQPAAYSQR